MNRVWQYLEGRRVKHIFHKSSMNVPVCGATKNSGNDWPPAWKTFPEQLKLCRPCGACKKIMGI